MGHSGIAENHIFMTIDFSTSWFNNDGSISFQGSSDDAAYKQVLRFLVLWNDASSLIQVQTSGSTGTPKTLNIPKSWMEESARRTLSQLGIPYGSKALLCISPFHIGGMMMIVRSIVHRMKLTVLPPSSMPLTEESFDFTAMVPLQVQTLLKEQKDLEKYGTLIIGGAPISHSLEADLQKRKHPVFATFGMTETVSNIALRRLNGYDTDAYFHCHPGISVSQEHDGRLKIRIPYMDDLELVTNDLVEVINESTFLWKGRADGVINSGAVKLIPELIESKLSKVIPNEFFISSKADESLGQSLILVLESPEIKASLIKDLQQVLSSYERPKAIYICDEFERTATGKILKAASLKGSHLEWSKADGFIGSPSD
jgi:O-succinylbenzoic acid--CoA ligase